MGPKGVVCIIPVVQPAMMYPPVLGYKATRAGRASSRDTPRVSRGTSRDAAPPSNVNPLVTMSSSRTLFSREPFTNCAAIDPSRPAADTNPTPDTLAAVGNASVETTPKTFHPQVLKALNRHAPDTTTTAPDPDPRAKRVAATAASAIDADNKRLRPTLNAREHSSRGTGRVV